MSERNESADKNPTLYEVWKIFGRYNANAILCKKRYLRVRMSALWISVIATLAAIIDATYLTDEALTHLSKPFFPNAPALAFLSWGNLVNYIIILLPITISILLAVASKLDQGSKWTLLRGAAEGIKQEIYRYRAQAEDYNPGRESDETRDEILASKIKGITERLMKTEINMTGLLKYIGEIRPEIELANQADDGFTDLSADDYVKYRLQSQMDFYNERISTFSHRMRLLNVWIILVGGAGTFIAAIGEKPWIALTTAVVAALTSFLEYNQLENTVTSYNQSLADLEAIGIWWRALPNFKRTPAAKEMLVRKTEEVLNAESLRWIRNMKDALKELDEQLPNELGGGTESIAKHVEITDGTYYGPTDTPMRPNLEPRDLTPEELAHIDELLPEDLGEDAGTSAEE